MNDFRYRRHFPTLFGRLPRMMASILRSHVVFCQRFAVELLLAIPFVGLFLAVVAGTRDGFFLTQAIVAAILVLPLAYLVLLLMIRQARGRSS